MPPEREPGTKPGAKVGSPEWRRRVSEGTRWALAKRRQLAQVSPLDLQHLESSGTVTEALRPFFEANRIEGARLVIAYEGPADSPNHRPLSVPRKAMLDEYQRAGLIVMGELARYAQTQDTDAGSRAITAMGRRISILEKLGLENAEHEVPDLNTYLAQRAAENRTQATNADESDTEPTDADDRVSVATGDSEAGFSPGARSAVPDSASSERPNGADGEDHAKRNSD